MIDKDKILQFIRMRGPVLPVDLSRQFGQDTIIMGAVLSELAADKQIFISNAKIGSSPLYYIKEQASKLTSLYQHMNEKDRRAYDLLKDKKILRDKELTPLLRVSLRQIKDFAKPITVKFDENQELFWRWYMFSSEEAGKVIQSFFEKPKPTKPQPKKPEPRPMKLEPKVPAVAKPIQKPAEQTVTEQKQLEPSIEDIKDKLHYKIKRFFNKKDIIIKTANVIRKNSEIEYIVNVQSAIGKIPYYCKVKSKKRINDSDLAAAFVRGQMKKLPVLFITTGVLTKKAKEMIGTEFENLKVIKIGGVTK